MPFLDKILKILITYNISSTLLSLVESKFYYILIPQLYSH